MTRTRKGKSLPLAAIELATDVFARQYGLSGPEIHRVFAPYTDALGTYPMPDKPSRWQIFQRGMEALNEEEQRRVLSDLLDRDWPGLDDASLDRLRQLLAGGTRTSSQQLAERLEKLDWAAVNRSWKETIALVERNPDGAIRAARTALESVCKHICEEREQPYPKGGDLARLYKAAASALNIAPDQHAEQIIKQILSGATTVVEGLAGLRNALSDAHGRGKASPRPAARHARLAVNMAFGLSTFLIDTHMEKGARGEQPHT